MKRKIFLTIIVFAILLCSFTTVKATTNLDRQALIQQLQQEIAQLTARINQLLTQQSTGATSATTASSTSSSWCHTFVLYLTLGSTDATTNGEVSYLQKALTQQGLNVQGYNTLNDGQGIFGTNTVIVLKKFQAEYGITQTGNVGPLTRTKLNALYGCPQSTVTNNNSTNNSTASVNCTPNWQCQATACINGFQKARPVDLNNCGLSSAGQIFCPDIVKQCGAQSACTPSCTNQQCGASDGCGGTCQTGTCSSGQICSSGQCITSASQSNSKGQNTTTNTSSTNTACTPNWQCDPWTTCASASDMRTTKCVDLANCVAPKTMTQPCSCTPQWLCSQWSPKPLIGNYGQTQTRQCLDNNACGSGTFLTIPKPIEKRYYCSVNSNCPSLNCNGATNSCVGCGDLVCDTKSGENYTNCPMDCPMGSSCVPDWECGPWGSCVNNQQPRICYDANGCPGTPPGMPPTTQACKSQAAITVTLPKGGETWQADTTQQITWTENQTSTLPPNNKVNLWLSNQGGLANYIGPDTGSFVDASTGEYSWALPADIIPGKYKVTLDGGDNVSYGMSAGYFTITAPAPCTPGATESCTEQLGYKGTHACSANGTWGNCSNMSIVAPNGGETWQANTTKTVTWNGSEGNHVMYGNGISMILMKPGETTNGYSYTLASGVDPSKGQFSLTIPTDIAPGQYKIAFVGGSPSSSYATWAVGADYFNITAAAPCTPGTTQTCAMPPYRNGAGSQSCKADGTWSPCITQDYNLTITSPSSGDSIKMGTTKTITWNSFWTPHLSPIKVTLKLANASGFEQQIDTATMSAGQYAWSVPNNLTPGKYFIEVFSDYASLVYLSGTFNIASTTCTPSWTCSTKCVDANTQGWYPVDANSCGATPSANTCVTTTQSCPLGCSNGQCATTTQPLYVTLTSPNGGETLTLGQPFNITWQTNVNIPDTSYGTIVFDLVDYSQNYSNGGLHYGVMGGSKIMPSAGQYSWTVASSSITNPTPPPVLTPGSMYKLEICYAAQNGTQVCDYSDNYFSIVAPTAYNLPQDSLASVSDALNSVAERLKQLLGQ